VGKNFDCKQLVGLINIIAEGNFSLRSFAKNFNDGKLSKLLAGYLGAALLNAAFFGV